MPLRTKIGIGFILLFLTVSAFVIRLDHASKTKITKVTIDESVYYRLAKQLINDPLDYESIRIAEFFRKDNPNLPIPAYMTQPLFKHPPLFTYFIVMAFKLFGINTTSVSITSCLFGVLMIPLGYLLGRLFFGEMIGLATAFFLWLDPINIICSQKIWLDTTLNFFIVLSIYFFAYAIKYQRDNYLLWGGLSAGLAMLTKYTGILPLVIMVLYGLIEQPEIFRNRKFWWSLVIPFMMLLPWAYWNYTVYGPSFLITHFQIEHGLGAMNIRTVLFLGFFILIGVGFIIRVLQGKSRVTENKELLEDAPKSSIRQGLMIGYTLLFLYVLKDSVWHSLNLTQFPPTSWQSGFFARHPLFYFTQLTEFSFFYFLAFLSFFIVNEERLKQAAFLYLSVVV